MIQNQQVRTFCLALGAEIGSISPSNSIKLLPFSNWYWIGEDMDRVALELKKEPLKRGPKNVVSFHILSKIHKK